MRVECTRVVCRALGTRCTAARPAVVCAATTPLDEQQVMVAAPIAAPRPQHWPTPAGTS